MKTKKRTSGAPATSSGGTTLADVILLSLSVVFLIIGIDQIITLGFGSAYWAMMLALVLFFVYNLRRRKK